MVSRKQTLAFLLLLSIFGSALAHAAPPSPTTSASPDEICGRLLQPLEMWEVMEPGFQVRMTAIIKKYPVIYRQAPHRTPRISNVGDPFLTDLEQTYGFHFSPPVTVPAFTEIMAQWTNQLQALLESGEYSRDDVFLPARVYRIPDGRLIPVGDGMHVPAGATSHDGGLSGREFKKILLQGFVPMGCPEATLNYGEYETFTHHDLVHLWSFIRYPNFARALRKSLRHAQQVGGRAGVFSKEWSLRFLDVVEASEVIRPEAAPEIWSYLDTAMPTGILTYADTYRPLLAENMGFTQRWRNYWKYKRALEAIRQNFNRFAVSYGGGAADPASRYTPGPQFRGSAAGLIQVFLHASTHSLSSLLSPSERIWRVAIRDFAELQLMLANLSQITIEEWVEQGLKPVIDKNSKFYQVFCASDIFRNVQDRQSYCGRE